MILTMFGYYNIEFHRINISVRLSQDEISKLRDSELRGLTIYPNSVQEEIYPLRLKLDHEKAEGTIYVEENNSSLNVYISEQKIEELKRVGHISKSFESWSILIKTLSENELKLIREESSLESLIQ